MMGRCKDCRHWGQENGEDYRGEDGYFPCQNPLIGEDVNTGGRMDAAMYPYSEGGCIFTGPEFGCVHFEPRQ